MKFRRQAILDVAWRISLRMGHGATLGILGLGLLATLLIALAISRNSENHLYTMFVLHAETQNLRVAHAIQNVEEHLQHRESGPGDGIAVEMGVQGIFRGEQKTSRSFSYSWTPTLQESPWLPPVQLNPDILQQQIILIDTVLCVKYFPSQSTDVVFLGALDLEQILGEGGAKGVAAELQAELKVADLRTGVQKTLIHFTSNSDRRRWTHTTVIQDGSLRIELIEKPTEEFFEEHGNPNILNILFVGFIVNHFLAGVVWLLVGYSRRMEEEIKERTQHLAYSQKQLETVLRSMDIGVIILIPETHHAAYANAKAFQLIGANPATPSLEQRMRMWIGQEWDHPELLNRTQFSNKDVVLQQAEESGEKVNLRLGMSPIEYNARLCLLVTLQDITSSHELANQLQQGQDNLRSFFETESNLLFVLDRNGYVLQANQSSQARLAQHSEDFGGHRLVEFVNEADRSLFTRGLFDALTGATRRLEVSFTWIGGTEFPVEMHMSPGVWDGENVVFLVAEDVSRLMDSQAKFSKLFYLNSVMMALVECEGNTLVEVNDAFARVLGTPGVDMVGESIWNALPLFGESSLAFVRDALSQQNPLKNYEVQIKNRENQIQVLLLNLEFFTVAGRNQVIVVLGDISQLKETEDNLRKAQQETELMANEALRASQTKSQFLANMSHEIRTPMNGVSGMTALLADTPMNLEQREYVEMIRKSADALLQIINDILDYSKIEAGRLEIEKVPIDIVELVESVGDTIGIKAKEKGIHFAVWIDPSLPAVIVGDMIRIRQVLLNLLGNAVKFTHVGEVVLRIDRCAETNGIRIDVRDTGIGIDVEHAAFLFQPFQQADATTTRKFGGTGLGLTISKQLVQMMGGDLQVESKIDEGSRFWFTLKNTLAEDTQDWIEKWGGAKPLLGQCWLLFDAHDASRHWESLLLESQGARVTQVKSLDELGVCVRSKREWSGSLIQSDLPSVHLATVLGEKFQGIPWLIRCVPMGTALVGGSLWLTQPLKPSSTKRILKQLEQKQIEVAHAPVSALNSGIGAGRRILLVEDNPINYKLAMRVLEKAGFEAMGAYNGMEALDILARHDFDAVLMDVQMPVMDGLAATRGIRSGLGHVRNSAITVIAMTANAMEGDRELCLAAGMNDYLTKPIQPVQVIEVILKWVK